MTPTTTRLTAGLVAAAAITAAAVAPASAGALHRPALAQQHEARGDLVSMTHLRTMSAEQVRLAEVALTCPDTQDRFASYKGTWSWHRFVDNLKGAVGFNS